MTVRRCPCGCGKPLHGSRSKYASRACYVRSKPVPMTVNPRKPTPAQHITINVHKQAKRIKPTGDSWWVKYARMRPTELLAGEYGPELETLDAEARRRFPSGVTQQAVGPLLKPLVS